MGKTGFEPLRVTMVTEDSRTNIYFFVRPNPKIIQDYISSKIHFTKGF